MPSTSWSCWKLISTLLTTSFPGETLSRNERIPLQTDPTTRRAATLHGVQHTLVLESIHKIWRRQSPGRDSCQCVRNQIHEGVLVSDDMAHGPILPGIGMNRLRSLDQPEPLGASRVIVVVVFELIHPLQVEH